MDDFAEFDSHYEYYKEEAKICLNCNLGRCNNPDGCIVYKNKISELKKKRRKLGGNKDEKI